MTTYHIVPSSTPTDLHAVGFDGNAFDTASEARATIELLADKQDWRNLEVTDSDDLARRGVTDLPKL